MLLSVDKWRIEQGSIEWTESGETSEGEPWLKIGLMSGKVILLGSCEGAPDLEDYLSTVECDLSARLIDKSSLLWTDGQVERLE